MKLSRRSGYAFFALGVFFLALAFLEHDNVFFTFNNETTSGAQLHSSVDEPTLPPLAHDTRAVVSGGLYPVAHIVDGDTFDILVVGERVRVRVLGINTPETVDRSMSVECYGPEASLHAKTLLYQESVRIEIEPKREREDRYGRLLAYAWLSDGTFYNEAMIRGGYAREFTVGKTYSYQREFRQAQTQARTEKIGLWGSCVSN